MFPAERIKKKHAAREESRRIAGMHARACGPMCRGDFNAGKI